MISNPYHIFQFGNMLCETNPKTKIFAKSFLRVNNRPLKPYFNSNLDICQCSSWNKTKNYLNKYP
jgi:hypothetical protein